MTKTTQGKIIQAAMILAYSAAALAALAAPMWW